METGVITQFYGAPGSGKTNLCFTLCVMLPSRYTAIYIDTESSFRPERIKAIARARYAVFFDAHTNARDSDSCLVTIV